MFRFELRGKLRFPKVLIKLRVFFQLYIDFLKMKYVLMIGADLSDWMLIIISFLKMIKSIVASGKVYIAFFICILS